MMIQSVNLLPRNLKSLADNGKRFTFYCFYVFGFVALLGFTIIATHFEFAFNPISLHYFEFFVLASCFFDVIFMILAGFKMFSLTKAANRLTHHKFETEKKRSSVLSNNVVHLRLMTHL